MLCSKEVIMSRVRTKLQETVNSKTDVWVHTEHCIH